MLGAGASVLFAWSDGTEGVGAAGSATIGDGANMGRALLASTRVGEERTSGHRPTIAWMVAIKSAMQEMMSESRLSRFACSFCSSLIRTRRSVCTAAQAGAKFDVPPTLSLARGLVNMTAKRSNSLFVHAERSPPVKRLSRSVQSFWVKVSGAVMVFSTPNV